MHKSSAFITLTFNEEWISPSRSLDHRDWQLFMKRLRRVFGNDVSSYMCGEYGDQHKRPHYHACLFGVDFTDKKLWKKSNGVALYRSATLESIWSDPKTKKSYGFSSIGDVTFQSAAYVARYITKKITGEMANEHYTHIDPATGECFLRRPEYTKMSLKPAIGKTWFEKYYNDVYPHDFIVVNGKRMKPPKYYDHLLERLNPEMYKDVKNNRKINALANLDNNSEERLMAAELIQTQRFSKLIRSLDREL
jgi:hypothetical protein